MAGIIRFRLLAAAAAAIVVLTSVSPLIDGQSTGTTQTTTTLFNTSNPVFLYIEDGFTMTAAAPGDMDTNGVIVALPTTENPRPHMKKYSFFAPTELGEWYTQPVQDPMTISGGVDFLLYVVSPIDESGFTFNFTFTHNHIPISMGEAFVNSLRANEPVAVQAFGGIPAPMDLVTGDILSLRINVTITSKSGANIYYGSRAYPSGVRIENTNSIAVSSVYGGEGILGMRFKEKFGIQAGTMFFKAKLDGMDVKSIPAIIGNTDRSIDVQWTLDRIPETGDHNAEISMGYSALYNVSLPAVAVQFPTVVTQLDLGETPCYAALIVLIIIIGYALMSIRKKRRMRIIEEYRARQGQGRPAQPMEYPALPRARVKRLDRKR